MINTRNIKNGILGITLGLLATAALVECAGSGTAQAADVAQVPGLEYQQTINMTVSPFIQTDTDLQIVPVAFSLDTGLGKYYQYHGQDMRPEEFTDVAMNNHSTVCAHYLLKVADKPKRYDACGPVDIAAVLAMEVGTEPDSVIIHLNVEDVFTQVARDLVNALKGEANGTK